MANITMYFVNDTAPGREQARGDGVTAKTPAYYLDRQFWDTVRRQLDAGHVTVRFADGFYQNTKYLPEGGPLTRDDLLSVESTNTDPPSEVESDFPPNDPDDDENDTTNNEWTRFASISGTTAQMEPDEQQAPDGRPVPPPLYAAGYIQFPLQGFAHPKHRLILEGKRDGSTRFWAAKNRTVRYPPNDECKRDRSKCPDIVWPLLFIDKCSNLTIRDFTFTGPGAIDRVVKVASDCHGILFQRCQWYRMPRMGTSGLSLSHPTTSHVVIHQCAFRAVGYDSAAHMLYMGASRYVAILECSFADCSGIYVKLINGIDHVTVADCRFIASGNLAPTVFEVEAVIHDGDDTIVKGKDIIGLEIDKVVQFSGAKNLYRVGEYLTDPETDQIDPTSFILKNVDRSSVDRAEANSLHDRRDSLKVRQNRYLNLQCFIGYCLANNVDPNNTGEINSDTHQVKKPLDPFLRQGEFMYFGTNLTFTRNSFTVKRDGEAQVRGKLRAIEFDHHGYNPPGRHHLLSDREWALFTVGASLEGKKAMLRDYFGLVGDRIHVCSNAFINLDRKCVLSSYNDYDGKEKVGKTSTIYQLVNRYPAQSPRIDWLSYLITPDPSQNPIGDPPDCPLIGRIVSMHIDPENNSLVVQLDSDTKLFSIVPPGMHEIAIAAFSQGWPVYLRESSEGKYSLEVRR